MIKNFLLGVSLIALVNTGFYLLLPALGIGPLVTFWLMLCFSMAALFGLGCLLHLSLEDHQSGLPQQRPDAGDVVLLQQPNGSRVTPISLDAQRLAQSGFRPIVPVKNGSGDSSALDATGVFLTRPSKLGLVSGETRNVPRSTLPEPRLQNRNGGSGPQTVDPTTATVRIKAYNPAPEPSPKPSGDTLSWLSIPDLMQEIHQHGVMIKSLLNRFQPRVEGVESQLHRVTANNAPEVHHPLATARKILSALDSRLARLRTALVSHDSKKLLHARDGLRQPLVLPKDAVHTLINHASLPALPPEEWATTLEALLTSAEQSLETPLQGRRENS